MGILFNINKPRGYRHIPIYYDPEKEEREERLKIRHLNSNPRMVSITYDSNEVIFGRQMNVVI